MLAAQPDRQGAGPVAQLDQGRFPAHALVAAGAAGEASLPAMKPASKPSRDVQSLAARLATSPAYGRRVDRQAGLAVASDGYPALAASGCTRCSGRVVAGRSAQPSLACIDSRRLPFAAWDGPSTVCVLLGTLGTSGAGSGWGRG